MRRYILSICLFAVFLAFTGRFGEAFAQSGASSYITNSTNLLVGGNFNIDGSGTADSLIAHSWVNVNSPNGVYMIDGTVVLGDPGNLFSGRNAGQLGLRNVMIGDNAGRANQAGSSDDMYIGENAGIANTTGSSNVFAGSSAGNANSTGSSNTFLGAQAGFVNLDGSQNTFTGDDAGLNNVSGGGNTFAGYNAGANTTASNNSFFGLNAGQTNTTGTSNTAIGNLADVQQNNLTNATAIGANSYVNASNAIVLGGFAGNGNGGAKTNVGIGLSAPLHPLDVVGEINTTTVYQIGGVTVLADPGNLFVGRGAGSPGVTGASNVFVGDNAGNANLGGAMNTFVGENAGTANTGGGLSTFVGFNAGFTTTTDNNNTFVGGYAGRMVFGASDNTFVGAKAGWTDDVGTKNTFVGEEAGQANTDGYQNTFVGYQAGFSNMRNGQNVFVGDGAGFNNTAAQNTFLGSASGNANTTGTGNTFTGYNSGVANIDGMNNTFTGFSSGSANVHGNNNTFSGYTAGNVSSGSNNTFSGYNVANGNTTGSNNSFFGNIAGQTNATGSNNTAIGNTADMAQADLSNATAIGANAYVNASNALVLGSISGQNGATNNTYVGIGTTTPTSLLHIVDLDGPLNGNIVQIHQKNSNPYAISIYNDNVVGGAPAGQMYGDNGGAFDIGTPGNNSFNFYTNGGVNPLNSLRMTITGAGNVGINTTTPSAYLSIVDTRGTVNGNDVFQIHQSNSFPFAMSLYNDNVDDANPYGQAYGDATGNFLIGNSQANSFQVFTDGFTNVRLTILGAAGATQGFVGINTTTPAQQLEVNGKIQDDDLPDGSADVNMVTVDGAGVLDKTNITSSDFLAAFFSGTYFQNNFGTILGPYAWLVGGNNLDTTRAIGSTNNQSVIVKTNNLDRMTFAAGGPVGIGTIAPQTVLHIFDSAASNASGQEALRISGSYDHTVVGSGPYLKFTDASNNLTGAIHSTQEATSAFVGLGFYTLPGTTNALRESMRILGNGNVGIGTNSPQTILHVNNTSGASTSGQEALRISGSYDDTHAGSGPFIQFADESNNVTAAIHSTQEATATYAGLGFYTLAGTTNTLKESMAILGNGNVGIGTVAPQTVLHVNDTAGASTSGQEALRISGSYDDTHAGSGPFIQFTDESNRLTAAIHSTQEATAAYAGLGFYTLAGTANTLKESMAILGNGNVGIGTTSPQTVLHVNDTAGASVSGQEALRISGVYDDTHAGSGPFIQFTDESNNATAAIHSVQESSAAYAGLGFYTLAGTTNTLQESMDILGNGNVGIGTASPSGLLHLSSSSTGGTSLFIDNTATGAKQWRVLSSASGNTGGAGNFGIANSTDDPGNYKLVINAAGDVGIGTNSPSALLSVGTSSALQVDANGNLSTSGSLTANRVLTNNGGTNPGAGASSSSVSAVSSTSNSSDMAGEITFTTTSAAAGNYADITFHTAYAHAPFVVLTPADQATAAAFNAHGGYFATPSATDLQVGFGGNVADGTYNFYYQVISY